MKKLRTWTYIAITAQVLSTGLAWVANGDIISSILSAAMIPLSFAAMGFVAMQIIGAHTARAVIRLSSWLLLLLSVSSVLLAVANDHSGAVHSTAAAEAIVAAGFASALLVVTLSFALWRAQFISAGIFAIGVVAGLGLIASNVDSINLMVIAASRAVMILFLVLLAQSLDPEVVAA